jgi:hypothetical protein
MVSWRVRGVAGEIAGNNAQEDCRTLLCVATFCCNYSLTSLSPGCIARTARVLVSEERFMDQLRYKQTLVFFIYFLECVTLSDWFALSIKSEL